MSRLRTCTLFILVLLFLSACGGSNVTTPTVDPDLVLTSVAETAYAHITETARIIQLSATPTYTPEPPTNTPLPPTETPTTIPTQMVLDIPSPTPTPVPVPTRLPGGEHCLKAQLTGETIKDGTEVTPAQYLVKKWTLLNIGGCTWTTDYKLVFLDGEIMNGPLVKNFHKAVPPGGWITITLELKAPTSLGVHRGYWMLRSNTGELFGVGDYQGPIWIDIKVVKP
ncbi:MAG: NBR1-Ig-like domain-containing protein [Chloroflexota bacterium]